MTSKTNSISSKQHLIGKICFLEEKYSTEKLACLVYWQNDKPIVFQIGMKILKRLLAPRLFEKVQEDVFMMECDALVDDNNNLSDIEITNIYESYNNLKLL